MLFPRHNDLPWQIKVYFGNQLDRFNLSENTTAADPKVYGDAWQTDIPRLRAGKVGAQVHTCTSTCEFIDDLGWVGGLYLECNRMYMYCTGIHVHVHVCQYFVCVSVFVCLSVSFELAKGKTSVLKIITCT